MAISIQIANRIGFSILGLTNNFAYVIMLSAAYDLLNVSSNSGNTQPKNPNPLNNSTQEKYCNEHSTSTILLADTLPSLAAKISYPFLLVGIPTGYKAIAAAMLSAAAFIITGLSVDQVLIFTGVVCASFSSGLGESTYLSNTPLYGDAALSSWSMGTGAAGLFGSVAYALLRVILPIRAIMLIMLIVPVAMIIAYFCVIKPLPNANPKREQATVAGALDSASFDLTSRNLADEEQQRRPIVDLSQPRSYGIRQASESDPRDANSTNHVFNFLAKMRYLPILAKYFWPLFLVYFAEYFINQGLFELVYYPEITYLNHPAQYRWFQVSYQLGVMISRSSLDLFRIGHLWAMSLLQLANAILFLAHASKLIYIPSFYIVIGLIIYEGLLGGFTYVNTFYRISKEVEPERKEFCISTVTMADSFGIVIAGLAALPVHSALCKLYD